MLSYGTWDVLATARGGDNPFLDIPYSSISYPLSINQTSSIRVSLSRRAGITCCEVYDEIEPWRDELAFYRNGEFVVAGPVYKVSFPPGEDLSIEVRDLSYWMNKRWIEVDRTITGNPARIYRELFDIGMDVDDSPNIECVVKDTVDDPISRTYSGLQSQRVAAAQQELSSSSRLDHVTVGRTMYAGDLNAIFGTSTAILHTEGFVSLGGEKDAEKFATDLKVIGNVPRRDRFPVEGRAERRGEYYGVLQESVTDLDIYDAGIADAAAAVRIGAWYPFPKRYQGQLSPTAEPEFDELIPGRVVDMKVSATGDCLEVNGEMLLSARNVNVSGVEEDISVEVIPVGEFDE